MLMSFGPPRRKPPGHTTTVSVTKKRYLPAPPASLSTPEEDAQVFQVDSPRDRPKMTRSKESIILWITISACIVWLSVLTFVAVSHRLEGAVGDNMGAEKKIVPIFETRTVRKHVKHVIPFNIIPDANSNGRIQTLSNLNFTFDRLLHYNVCCFQQLYFVCRTSLGMKNLGVDAYLTSEQAVIVHVLHPDMVGARCELRITCKLQEFAT